MTLAKLKTRLPNIWDEMPQEQEHARCLTRVLVKERKRIFLGRLTRLKTEE
jgi:hypothetical protein